MNHIIRIGALLVVLGACLVGIAELFWNQEMRYQLPTPVPASYQEVAVGTHISLPSTLKPSKSHFLHFYNPDCPCSRFNAQHLRSLIGEYADSIEITVVVATASDVAKARAEFGEQITIITDTNGSIASACGVYSTPQAAIVNSKGELYYRGNYNSSRYCTSRASNFAELSLIALINNQPSPSFGLLATQSYGCELKNGSRVELTAF